MKIELHCYHAKARSFCQINICSLSTTLDGFSFNTKKKTILTSYRSLHNSKNLFYTMYKCLGNQLPHLFKPKMIYFTFSHTKNNVASEFIR